MPITGRRQIDFIPLCVANWIKEIMRAEEDQEREELLRSSLGSDDPGMQGFTSIFNRLVRASGLDDRDWEFRVVLDPCG